MAQTNSDKTGTSPKSTAAQSSAPSSKMRNSEFHQFFVDELKDIYWAEKHLSKALPKMQKASTSSELAAAFEKHTQETERHAETLEEIFELLEEKAVAEKCKAMEGLTEEAEEIISDTESDSSTRDAGLILAAQKVEHYEIATYGTLYAFAQQMGHTDVAELLQQTLDNEKSTDVALTKIAESFINEQATAE
ncbi:YciE/YciF ferroxidase family protein [Niabella aquatica]